MRPCLAAAAILVAACTRSATCHASEPTAGDKETSRDLFAAGMRALDAHDFATAERTCGGAFKLVNAPTGALCWGQGLEGLGKLVEARDAYLLAAHYPQRPDEPLVFTSARDAARAGAERVEKRIATVVLHVSGAAESAPLRVAIDGAEIVGDTARLPRKVNPGRHVLFVASAGYRTVRVEADTKDGEEEQVEVHLERAVGDEVDRERVGGSSRSPFAYLSFVIGGVGTVAGSVFGAMALHDANALRSIPGCPSSCQTGASQISSLHRDQWGADVGFGVGIAGLGIGAVLLLTSKAGGEASSTAVDVGPGVVRLRGAF